MGYQDDCEDEGHLGGRVGQAEDEEEVVQMSEQQPRGGEQYIEHLTVQDIPYTHIDEHIKQTEHTIQLMNERFLKIKLQSSPLINTRIQQTNLSTQ
jgi:hypothetical protein